MQSVAGKMGIFAVSCLFSLPVQGDEKRFTPEDIIEWESHSFEGETRYELVEVNGEKAVHGICEEATASGLFYREDIDLTETPVIEWRWRVKETFSDIDETEKAGDDYAVRLYVVKEHSIRRWRTRALNYVWASEKEKTSDWPNAYQSRAHMIAMDSGPPDDDDHDGWRSHARNIAEDFKTFHDTEIDTINGLAIMTDCDDVKEPIEGWYGEIRLRSE